MTENSLIFDLPAFLKLPLALAIVLGLILLLAFLARRVGPFAGALPKRKAAKRLAIVASQPLDNKRRVILIRRDGVEHLLMVGGQTDLVIETGIPCTDESPAHGEDPLPQAEAARPPTSEAAHGSHRQEPTFTSFPAGSDASALDPEAKNGKVSSVSEPPKG